MYKAHVINDISLSPVLEPDLGCSHIFIFKKEKKAKIVFKTAQIAYKEEYHAIEKELSDRLNSVAKNGFAYCDEAVITHDCRVGTEISEHGQHMAIRFEKVNYIPEYRVYLGPIVCIEDTNIAEKEGKTKIKPKIGCRTKYPTGEQHLNFYNDTYNDDFVRAANNIYRLDDISPDRKLSGFSYFDTNKESENNRIYKSEIEKQIEEDFQNLAKEGFKFQQLITIPVNGEERNALLFSKTGSKTLSFSGESIFLDGFELWYQPIVYGRFRRWFWRIFPSYFDKKDQLNDFIVHTDIEDTERLEAVYTKAFNEQLIEEDSANHVEIPITIISKTRVPHFGEDVQHLFLIKDLVLRGLITTEVFRKITKKMIAKSAAETEASVDKDSARVIKRSLKREYRKNMRILTKPHVDVFLSSIAVSVVDNNADNSSKPQSQGEPSIPVVEEIISTQNCSAISSSEKDPETAPKTIQIQEVQKGEDRSSLLRKSFLKYILIALGGFTIIGAIGSLLVKSCGEDASFDEVESVETEMNNQEYLSSDNESAIEASLGVLEPEGNEDHIFDGETRYVGTINETISITMLLIINGKEVSGNYFYGSGSNGSIALSGTRIGSTITMIETDANGKNTGKFVGELDGLSFYGTFTNLSSGKEFPFCVDSDVPDDEEEQESVTSE